MKAALIFVAALPVALLVTARLMWDALTASEAERQYMDGEDDDGGMWPEFGGGIAPVETTKQEDGQ